MRFSPSKQSHFEVKGKNFTNATLDSKQLSWCNFSFEVKPLLGKVLY